MIGDVGALSYGLFLIFTFLMALFHIEIVLPLVDWKVEILVRVVINECLDLLSHFFTSIWVLIEKSLKELWLVV